MDWSWTARTHRRTNGSIVQGTHRDAAAIAGCAADNDGKGSRCGTKGGKVSAMSMIAIRLPASCAALLLIAAALAQARLVRAPTLMSTRE